MVESPLRVLIVDDEAPARHRLRELLDDCAAVLPISVIGEAQHGREALDILHSASADLVLTDIHMPGMDGIELARHLLKLARPPVVMFTTAFHQHEAVARSLYTRAGDATSMRWPHSKSTPSTTWSSRCACSDCWPHYRRCHD